MSCCETLCSGTATATPAISTSKPVVRCRVSFGLLAVLSIAGSLRRFAGTIGLSDGWSQRRKWRIRVNSSCASLASFRHKRLTAALETPCTASEAGLVGDRACIIEGRGPCREALASQTTATDGYRL